VLARHDLPANHVVGGSNLNFWPVGPLARRAGVVFIRRSFGQDEIYKTVVAEYFGYLLSKRFNLEWYFEGGRSRTGKLRAPRYGLLHYVAEALQSGRAEDVYLVPVSITYDRLAEVSQMAAEQAGAVKKKEGLTWLARYAQASGIAPAPPRSGSARLSSCASGWPAQTPASGSGASLCRRSLSRSRSESTGLRR
jgi:glycerol-3-phosphate O-acyltransferase